LILSAVINERQEADSSLKKALENLELKVIERTQKLEQSEAQIDGFFSSAPIGMGIIDHNLRYLRVNQVLAEINRKSIKEHLGNSIQEVLPELGLDVEELFYQVLRTGKPLVNVEVSSNTLSPTKTEQTWLTSYFPIFDVEHIPLSVGFVVIEITDRKMIEAKLIEAKSILAYANLELEKLVNLDGLTQIANRRCFNDRLELEWERLAREQQPLALLLFDIDYFKRYNDCYGHQIGDDCLILIAQTATKSVQRPADLVARYGGEEFVVVLPNTDLEGAIGVAHEIQNAIMKLAIPHQNSDISDIVTISLGVTSLLPNRDQKSSILIKQADIALYNAKNQGRNCLVSFSNINL
jgi:diguanylate cyclase (GGDEF)-like protein/PAS domain S-box-containing protein